MSCCVVVLVYFIGEILLDHDDGEIYRVEGFREYPMDPYDEATTLCDTYFNSKIKEGQQYDDDFDYTGVYEMLHEESYECL